MVSFMDAVKWMREGKKVERGMAFYAVLVDDMNIVFMNKREKSREGTDQNVSVEDIEATDWEIYKEEDKEYYGRLPDELFSEEVKDLLNKPVIDEEFKAEIKKFGEACENVLKKKKEEITEVGDNWNLADKTITVAYKGNLPKVIPIDSIKIFIQKVKEDIWHTSGLHSTDVSKIIYILDKRAGEL